MQLDNEDEGTSNSDPLYDANAYDETRNGTNGDDVETADKDNLAWFLKDGDDDLTGSSTADYANLGDGEYLLLLGQGDSAYGGAGEDSFSLDIRWDQTSGSASIHDYDADLDDIMLIYEPEFDAEGAEIPPVVTIVQNVAGGYAAILLNGEQVATVTAVPDMLAAEIALTAG